MLANPTDVPKETGRLESFSDGVFAVAITLLILQIPPILHSHDLLRDVGAQWQSFVAYAVSFVTILVMWINHQALFQQIHRSDRIFQVLNGLLLMVVTFVNYPTALVATFLTQPATEAKTAMALYSGTYVVIALLFTSLWFYAAYHNRLLGAQANPAVVAAISRAYRLGPLFYLVTFAVAFLYVPASLALNGVLALYFALTGRDV